jgi:glycosyltransferase involved in cell wall biosynthesis
VSSSIDAITARTLLVVPAFNEEESLPATLKELRAAVPELDLLVVDDGSTDATRWAAQRVGAVVLRLPFNLGVGSAVRTGLRYADEQGYDRAVVLDADGQHEPAGVVKLLEALDAGADLAVGSRFADGARTYEIAWARRQAMRFLSFVVRVSSGQRFSDTTSGFRAFDRPVIELLAREYPAAYLADTVEALIIVLAARFRIVEIPVVMRPRAGGMPSTRRLRLTISYLRALIGVLGTASIRHRVRGEEP